jgi:hypothetical protein
LALTWWCCAVLCCAVLRYCVAGVCSVSAHMVVLKARQIFTDELVAIKLHSSQAQWSREVEAYKVLRHKTLVARMEEAFTGSDTTPPCIVLEWGFLSLETWCKDNAGIKYKVKAVLTQVGT